MTIRLISLALALTMSIAGTATEIADIHQTIDPSDVDILAQLVWGEARGIKSDTEKAAVIWVVLNRVENPQYPDTIRGVVTQRMQFTGWHSWCPVEEEFQRLALDVLTRWELEKRGKTDTGRFLPKDILYFCGNGLGNSFYRYVGGRRQYIDISDFDSPYEV